MNPPDLFVERVRNAFSLPTRGVVGLVDELLAISGEHPLQLNWCEGKCSVNRSIANPPIGFEVPISKSVFRAVLARIANLCGTPTASVSPYGGTGEIVLEGIPASSIRVKFVNTATDQTVELLPVAVGSIDAVPATRESVEQLS